MKTNCGSSPDSITKTTSDSEVVVDGKVSGLPKILDNYDELLSETFTFYGINSEKFSRNDLLVIISWMKKYYEGRLKQSKDDFIFLSNLRQSH